MKKILYAAAAAACLLCFSGRMHAQADIKIGQTKIRLQSPVKVYEESGSGSSRSYWNRSYTTVFGGFSFPVEGCSYESTVQMPVKYGNSFEVTLGVKEWYCPSRHYSIGLSVQYSHYDYRADGSPAAMGIITGTPIDLDIYREIYKTDNIGIGIYNRFSFFGSMYLDIGAYGDWAFNRQYKCRYYSGDSKEHFNYRDGGKFLPLQGGVYGALGYGYFSVYCKYRFTHLFSHSRLPVEPPRLSIGLMVEL